MPRDAPGSDDQTSLLWTLEEISRLASRYGDPQETLANIVAFIHHRFGTDVCSVYLLEPDRRHLVLSATIGLSQAGVGAVRMPMGEGLVGLVAEQLSPQVAADVVVHPRFKYFPDAGEDRYRSFLGVPIIDRGLLQGVLVLQTIESRDFSDDAVRLLLMAGAQLAPIVSDVRLEQRQAIDQEIAIRAKAELLETLAGGVAHELNNKLMPMLGFAELLVAEATDANQPRLVEYGQTIRDSAEEASRIIRQLLQLSKPTHAEPVAADLRELVRQAIPLVSLRLKEAGIPLALELPETPVPVVCDGGQLKQVLVNLVWNAIDAMEDVTDRHLTIRVQSNGRTAALACIDRGAGISGTVLPKVCDPFFTTKAPSRGTGLGLSTCLAIIRQHGGEMRVTSTVGVGTSVHLTLPVRVAPAGAPPAAAPEDQALPDGARVLVADDEERVADLVARALRSQLGCEVQVVRSGHAAQAALGQETFDLVLSDIRMPDGNGADLLAWIERHRPDLRGRLLFMTGDANVSALNETIRRAGLPIIQKPFTIRTLMAVASQVLGRV